MDQAKMPQAARFSGSYKVANDAALLRWLVDQAIEKLAVERVWLFGSRARGDHLAISDYDLAFLVPPDRDAAWTAFCAEADEEAPTLHRLDLINMRTASAALQEHIYSEGKIIYDAHQP